MRIAKLNCRVTVRTGARAETPLQKDAKSPRPAMAFALPQAAQAQETEPSTAQTATGSQERDMLLAEATRHVAAQGRRADPKLVAERVYELMRDEMRLARLRSGHSR